MPKTPQHNGVAERMNRKICERARSMRIHADLSKSFWAEAVNASIYLINRGPSTAIDCKLPEEEWTGKEISLAHVKVFGCTAYALLKPDERSKLDPKSKVCSLIGYDGDSFGYKLWDHVGKEVIRSKDVVFNENVLYKDRERKRNNL